MLGEFLGLRSYLFVIKRHAMKTCPVGGYLINISKNFQSFSV